MGKPSAPQVPYRDDPDAVSLHTTPGEGEFDDDIPQISPPAYTDDASAGPSAPFLPASATQRIDISQRPGDFTGQTEVLGKVVSVANDAHIIIDPSFDTDPVVLQEEIVQLSYMPPRPKIHIVGSHRETVRKGNKTETSTVTDFRITLDMTDYLYPVDPNNNWRPPIRTVENGEKVYRGGILTSRAPGYKADLEVGDAKPTLREWCHRYCASSSYLKVFRLSREVTGLDEKHFKSRLEGIIRSTKYRGSISITFPVVHKYADIYSSTRVNQWRHTTWIRWVFYLTFLWLFTWPYLFFATKRYAVVKAEWPFSKVDGSGRKIYARCSEEQWLERFAIAIRQLALDRFQGDAGTEYLGQVLERPETHNPNGGQIQTGHAGVDAAVGFLQGGLRAANDVNRLLRFGNVPQEGWGYDT